MCESKEWLRQPAVLIPMVKAMQHLNKKLNPIQERGHIVRPHHYHSISFKMGLEFYIFCFSTWLSGNFPFRKFQLPQLALKYVAMAVIQLFGIVFQIGFSILFAVSPAERILALNIIIL